MCSSDLEIAAYRKLLAEDDSRNEVHAHLLAALIDLGDWVGARTEIEALLTKTPEEPQLRFLHSEALSRTGEKAKGQEERLEARRLGLTYEREAALCGHLGLPAPEPPAPAEEAPTAPVAPPPKKRPAPRKARPRPARPPTPAKALARAPAETKSSAGKVRSTPRKGK